MVNESPDDNKFPKKTGTKREIRMQTHGHAQSLPSHNTKTDTQNNKMGRVG